MKETDKHAYTTENVSQSNSLKHGLILRPEIIENVFSRNSTKTITCRLFALDFYEAIVDLASSLINYLTNRFHVAVRLFSNR